MYFCRIFFHFLLSYDNNLPGNVSDLEVRVAQYQSSWQIAYLGEKCQASARNQMEDFFPGLYDKHMWD